MTVSSIDLKFQVVKGHIQSLVDQVDESDLPGILEFRDQLDSAWRDLDEVHAKFQNRVLGIRSPRQDAASPEEVAELENESEDSPYKGKRLPTLINMLKAKDISYPDDLNSRDEAIRLLDEYESEKDSGSNPEEDGSDKKRNS